VRKRGEQVKEPREAIRGEKEILSLAEVGSR